MTDAAFRWWSMRTL